MWVWVTLNTVKSPEMPSSSSTAFFTRSTKSKPAPMRSALMKQHFFPSRSSRSTWTSSSSWTPVEGLVRMAWPAMGTEPSGVTTRLLFATCIMILHSFKIVLLIS